MENSQEILGFANIDIVDYLNKIHVTPDHFLIENQKHNLKKYQKELNDHLHLLFLENCDSLLTVLDTYNFCYSMIDGLVVPTFLNENEDDNIHAPACLELKKAFKLFKDDMNAFLTGERYLIASEVFGQYYCVLTNDILFIGQTEVQESDYDISSSDNAYANKTPEYTLKSCFNKNAIVLINNGTELVVHANNAVKYTMNAKCEIVDEFYSIFQESIYDPTDVNTVQNGVWDSMNIDQEYIEYLIETEQICELQTQLKTMAKNETEKKILKKQISKYLFNKKIKISNISELKILLDIFDEPLNFLRNFLLTRFSENIYKLNKIQRTNGLINDAFDYLEMWVSEIKYLYGIGEEENNSNHDLDSNIFIDKNSSETDSKTASIKLSYSFFAHFLITIESAILKIFNVLERRIHNKFYKNDENQSAMNLIKKRLCFQEMDFVYLADILVSRRIEFSEGCISRAKKEIKQKIDSMFI